MRPTISHSFRSTVAVALLLAGFAGASSCAVRPLPPSPRRVTLDEAVRRTLAAGSARIRAEVRGHGGTVTVVGVTSLRDATSSVVASMPEGEPVEVRTTPTGTWLRARPDQPWVEVAPAVVRTVGVTTGWHDLLGGLRPAARTSRTTGALKATHDGAPATVHVDDAGRIRRVRIDRRTGTLDLGFSDHGTAVEVHPP